MRIIFCGSGNFAVESLRAVVASDYEVAAVITQPARKAGRGAHLRRTPISELCRGLSITPIECEDINDSRMVETIKEIAPDVICVVDFGQFVRKAVRDCAKIDTINLHGSLLPELRGAAPVNWAIIRGYEITGVTTFSLVGKMDAGAMIAQTTLPIDPHETADELKQRLAVIGGRVVCETLGMLAGGWANYRQQDESKVTFAPCMNKADGIIDFNRNAVEIRNLIHGTWPWPGGQVNFVRSNGKEIHALIARARVIPGPAQSESGVFDSDLFVGCGEGKIEILEIQPAGKRLMKFCDFQNGYRVEVGNFFRQITTNKD